MRRVIFAALCAAALMATPASAATNGQLAVIGNTALFTLNPDGSGLLNRWDPGSPHFLKTPAWSPDGNAIALVDDGKITVFDLASGQARALTAGPSDTSPSWSPDGRRIAFGRDNQVLTMARDGSDVQPLLELDPWDDVYALAWAPDGSAMALVTGGTLLRVDLDDAQTHVLAPSGVTGSPSWSPDATRLAYTASAQIRLTSAGIVADGASPAFSPDGLRLVFSRFTSPFLPSLATMTIADAASAAAIPQASRIQLRDPEWQPCVAGVTVSCVSPGWRCSDATLTAIAGSIVTTDVVCPGATRISLLDAPTGGGWGVGARSDGKLSFRAPTTFAGTKLIHFRASRTNGETSEIATLTVTVTPKPAAPKLSVIGQPELDKRGRVLLRGICDRACSVSLRVIIRLNSQRVLRGRVMKASAPAGGTLRLRLQRAKLPRHRRIAAARIAGTLKGPDGLQRNFTLSLIP
jgi:hypothetical protein